MIDWLLLRIRITHVIGVSETVTAAIAACGVFRALWP
jgi:hypothetical protein